MSKHFNKEEFLNKTIEWMRGWAYQEFAGAPVERYIGQLHPPKGGCLTLPR